LEIGVCSGAGEYALDDLRSNDLAGSAPGGEAVEDKKGIFDLKRLGPVVLPTALLAIRARSMTSSSTATASATRRRNTHVCKLCTPSLPILLVCVKNRSLSRGRYTVVMFVEEVRFVTDRRRDVVSRVLLKAGVANMIYVQNGVTRQATDFKGLEDGMHWAQAKCDYNCEALI
jgi:hypothetical protein